MSATDAFQDSRPFYGQDPHVTEYNYDFLLIEAQDEERIQIRQIPDLADLHTNTTIVVHDHPREHLVWAPELHFLPEHDRWFIYYAASDGNNETHRNYVLRSESPSPLSQYEFLGQVRGPDGEPDYWGIDLTTFLHDNQRYAVWSSRPPDQEFPQSLYIARMTSPTQLQNRTLLASPTLPWETSHQPILEGPQFHYPYLFYSANASWTQEYATGVLTLRGTNPLGSAHWQKHPQPLLTNAGHGHPIADRFIYHKKLSLQHGWNDRVLETIPYDSLERRLPSANDD